MDKIFVSGRWVCDKFGICHRTLMKIVDCAGDDRAGVVKLPGMKQKKFLRKKIEALLTGNM